MTVAVKTLCAQIKSTMHSCVHYAFQYVSEFNLNLHCKVKTKEKFEPNTILLYIDAKIL